MDKYKVLVVEDNLLVSAAVQDILTDAGFSVVCADTGKAANEAVAKAPFNVVILDMMLPDANGKDLLAKWHTTLPDMMVVMMTAHGDVPTAVECLQIGACDFLTKPVEKHLLIKTVENAVRHLNMVKTVSNLTELTTRELDLAKDTDVIARSEAMLKTLEMVKLVSRSDFSCILIKGESGTGKGLLARTIHKLGNRANKPFVEVNCSAIPANLIESELFGHKKGAFTDAKEDKAGLFELADSGTIFLDEIGDMDFNLQAKLLKALEEQKFRRIGGTADITVNVAVIAATNQDVEKLVKENKFRLDLYYRLNVIPIELAPLRERKEDIEVLAEHFLKFFSRKFGKHLTGFSDRAKKALLEYSWPGNVREFRNVVERGSILSAGPLIEDPAILFPYNNNTLADAVDNKSGDAPVRYDAEHFPVMTLAEAEKLAIQAALREAEGNKNKAAAILGLHRTTLYKKIEEYHLETT